MSFRMSLVCRYTNSFCLVNFPLIFSHFLFKWHWDRIRLDSIVMKPVIKPPENWSDSMPTIGRSDLIWCVNNTEKWSPFLLFQSIPCHGTQVRNYKIKQGIWQLFVRKTKIILILIEFYLLLTLGICLCKSNAKCGVYM